MSPALERQNTVTTLQTAAGWLKQTPALVGLFFVFGLINAAGQLNVVVSLLGSLVSLVFAGIVHLSAADKVNDTPTDIAANAEAVVRKLLSLIGIALVAGIATFVATLFFIIPGIYVGLRLGLAPVACVIDDYGIADSLSESWDVAHGNLLKLLGIQFLLGLVPSLLLVVLVFATGSAEALTQGNNSALFVPFVLLAPVTAVIGPLTQFAIARVYLENRGEDVPTADETPAASETENLTVQPDDDDWDQTTEQFDDQPAVDSDSDSDDQDDLWDDR